LKNCNRNFIKALLIIIFINSKIYSQTITLQSIPSGPYGSGSSISVLFNTTGVFPINNVFNLYLSDQNGSFANPTLIGSEKCFYAVYVNGLIPSTALIPSPNYKLRVDAVDANTQNIVASSVSSAIQINSSLTGGTNGDANGNFITPGSGNNLLINQNLNYFGNCVSDTTAYSVSLTNNTSSLVNYSITNEFNNTSVAIYNRDPFASNTNLTINSNATILLSNAPTTAHYLFFQSITDPTTGIISTKSFLFINNNLSAPFSTLLNSVCYSSGQLGDFNFKVDIDPTKVGSAYFNFPGDIYFASWDDGGKDTVTIQTIIANNGLLSHGYSQSSCGHTVITANSTVYNSFGPSLVVKEVSICAQNEQAITPVQIFPKPIISFSGPSTACLGSSITFTNTSILGSQGPTTQNGCTLPNITYKWFVDDSLVSTSTNLTVSNLTVGNHTILLNPIYSNSSLTCTPSAYSSTICVQSAPPNAAAFALVSNLNTNNADTTFCPNNSSFIVYNQSGTLTSNNSCTPFSYNWVLTGPNGFTTISSTSTNSNPNFNFPVLTIPGSYVLSLSISNSCGTSASYTRNITVFAIPTITSQPTDQTICLGSNATFSVTANGSGIIYQWQLSTDGGITFSNIIDGGSYYGANNSSLNITNPTIQMNGYHYRVIVSGSCGNINSTIVLLTINSIPSTPTISNNGPLCVGTTLILNAPLVSNATYSWSGPISYTSTAQSPIVSNNATVGMSGIYSLIVTVNGCSSSASTTNVLVNASNTAGLPSSNPTLCINTALTPITIATTGATGIGTPTGLPAGLTASWLSNMITISGTPTVSGTFNYTIPLTGGCGIVNATGTIIVNPISVAGTISGASTVCGGTNSTILTLNGNIGSIQWQLSNDNSTFTNIGNATGQTYTATNLTTTTYYRAIVTSGLCSSVTTSSIMIMVIPVSVAGTISGASAVCSGTNSTQLTLNGYSGSIQWQSSSDNVTFTNISNANGSTYTANDLTTTTYYRAIVTSGICSSATTSSVTITVNPIPVASIISSTNSICSNSTGSFTIQGTSGSIVSYTLNNGNIQNDTLAGGIGTIYITNATTQETINLISIYNPTTGCSQSLSATPNNSATISIKSLPVLSAITTATGNNYLCSNTTLQLSSSPNGGIWGSSNSNYANVNSSGLVTGIAQGSTTIQYTYTDPNTSCSNSVTQVISVDPTPSMVSQSKLVYCNNSYININLNSSPSLNVSYNWTSDNQRLGNSVNGSNATIQFTGVNNSLTEDSVIFSIVPTYTNPNTHNQCIGSLINDIVVVNPTISLNATSSFEVCANSPLNTIQLSTNIGNNYHGQVQYIWSNSQNIGFNNQTVYSSNSSISGSNTYISITGVNATPIYDQISVTPQYVLDGISCPSSTSIINYTVDPVPIIDNTISTLYECNANNVQLTWSSNINSQYNNNIKYQWVNSNTNIGLASSGTMNSNGQLNFTTTNIGTSDIVGTISVIPSYEMSSNNTQFCSGNSYSIYTIKVLPTPAITSPVTPANDIYVCSQINTYSIPITTNISGGQGVLTYTWTGGSNIGLANQTNVSGPIPSFLAIDPYNYTSYTSNIQIIPYYTEGGRTCTGNDGSFNYTISPIPIISPISNDTVCNGSLTSAINITTQIQSADNALLNYSWTSSNPNIGILSGTGSTISQATLVNNSSPKQVQSSVINVTVGYQKQGNASVCLGTQSFTFYVLPTLNITSSLPNINTCQNNIVGSISLATDAISGSHVNYSWTVSDPSIGLSSSVGDVSVTQLPSFTAINLSNSTKLATITVTPWYYFGSNYKCAGNPKTYQISVDPLPIAIFTDNTNGVSAFCEPHTVTFTDGSTTNGQPIINGVKTWTISQQGGGIVGSTITLPYSSPLTYSFTNTGIIDSVYTVTLNVITSNGCPSSYSKMYTIHPNAFISWAFTKTSACAPFIAIGNSNIKNTPYSNIDLLSSYNWVLLDHNHDTISVNGQKIYNSVNPPNYTIVNPNDTVYVHLLVNSIYGCTSAEKDTFLYTHPNPKVNFTVSPDTACAVLTTQAINNSYITYSNSNATTSTLSYKWYANSALLANINSQNPAPFVLYNNSNTKDSSISIKLIATDNVNFCSDSTSITALIHPKPKANFTINNGTRFCALANGVSTGINNTSLFQLNTSPYYQWQVFNNGIIDHAVLVDSLTIPHSATSPNFTFPDSQGKVDTAYTLRMVISTIYGCADTLSVNDTISRRPLVNFSINALRACGIDTLRPLDNTANIANDSLNRIWTVIPSSGVTINNGFSSSPALILPVNTTPNSITYNIKQSVTSLNGCSDSLSNNFIIDPKPTASFNVGLTDSCGPWTKNFVNTSDPKNGLPTSNIISLWQVLDSKGNILQLNNNLNLQYTFTNSQSFADSIYQVRLLVTNPFGCKDTTSFVYDTVHPNALAYFTGPNKACAPFNVQNKINLQDYSNANNENYYVWNIFDMAGNVLLSSTTTNGNLLAPNYTINTPGDQIRLQLIAHSKFGCLNSTYQDTITTYPNTVSAVIVSNNNVCSNSNISLNNGSYGIGLTNTALTYQWFINNQYIGSPADTTMKFINNRHDVDSIVFIKLVATNPSGLSGCNDTTIKQITVFPTPKAQFSIQNIQVCGSISGTYDSLSDNSVSKNNVLNDIWSITSIPSGASYQIQPTNTPNVFKFQLGDNTSNQDIIYQVKLLDSSIDGCKDSAAQSIALNRRPIVDFKISQDTVCGQQTIELTDNTLNVPANKKWTYQNINNGPSLTFVPNSSQPSPQLSILPNTGSTMDTYYITQYDTTLNGCTGYATKAIYTKPIPVANFSLTPSSSCYDTVTVNLKDNSSPTGALNKWSFSFGDGTSKIINGNTSPILSHFYNGKNLYTISLIVTDTLGCSSLPFNQQEIVYGSPTALFSPIPSDSICLGTSVGFLNNSSGTGMSLNEIVNYNWNFGDGSYSSLSAPNHLYAKEGKYTVVLSTNSSVSCMTAKDSNYIIVRGVPKAGFTDSNYCEFLPVTFTDTSKAGYADQIGNWNWNFGDNSPLLSYGILNNPIQHAFNNVAKYNVALTVSGLNCPQLTNTMTLPIVIIPARKDSVYPIVNLDYNTPKQVYADTLGAVSYLWSPSNNLSGVNQSSEIITMTPGSNHEVYTIRITDTAGCVNNDKLEVWAYNFANILLPRAFFADGTGQQAKDNIFGPPIFIPNQSQVEVKIFKIYDRFGHEVFSNPNQFATWDGETNGIKQPMGTYVWVIEAYIDGRLIKQAGNVTLIRH